MKKWLAIVLIFGLTIGMLSLALSAQAASSKDAGEIGVGAIFEWDPGVDTVLTDVMATPPDMDQIVFAGTQTETAGVPNSTMAINTLCGLPPLPTGTPVATATPSGTPTATATATPCLPFDIYLHIVFYATWSQCCGSAHTSMEVDLNYGTGASSNSLNSIGTIIIPCTIDTPYTGTCALDTYIQIHSSDIQWRTDWPQLGVQWTYPWWTGGGGNTFDVNYMVTFAEHDLNPVLANCDSQFLAAGTPLASGSVAANNPTGVNIFGSGSLGLAVGDWVEIVTSGGPWYNNGDGAAQYGMAMKTDMSDWAALTSSVNSSCNTTSGDYAHAYIQLTSTNMLALRVNDTDGAWNWNTGYLGYSVFKVTYSPYPATGCAEQYVIGDLIGSVTVSVNAINGQAFISTVNLNDNGYPSGGAGEIQARYLMIETSGVFTLPLSGSSGTGQLKKGSGGTWSSMATYPDAACIVQLDPIGHYEDFIPYTGGALDYFMRANGVNLSGASGSLTFSVYLSTKMQVMPPTGTIPISNVCDSYYSHVSTHTSLIIPATNSSGLNLTLDPTKYYALETTSGPWYNNGTDSSYAVALSADGGTTWFQITNFPSALCSQSADGNHVLVYIKPLVGRNYKVRVYDPDDDYADGNTGNMGLNIYIATPFGEIVPWITCGSSYILTEVNSTDSDRTAPAVSPSGVLVKSYALGTMTDLISGKIYALDVDPTYAWKEGGSDTNRYDYQISEDNGTNWINIDDTSSGVTGLLCVTHVDADPNSPFRIYFTARNGFYRIRVHDQNSNFNDNQNFIVYRLYTVTSPGDGEIPGGPWPNSGYDPIVWGPGCTDVCQRPPSLYYWVTLDFQGNCIIQLIDPGASCLSIHIPLPVPDLGGWLEYGRCAIQHYISWCQEDTATLLSIPTHLEKKEPFGTILELQKALTGVQTIIASYNFGGASGEDIPQPSSLIWGVGNSGGSGSGSDPSSQLLPIVPSTSIWNGGPLDLTIGDAGEKSAAYIEYCKVGYSRYIGNASEGMCYALAIMQNMGNLIIWIQLLLDLSGVTLLIGYIWNKWVGAGGPMN